MSNRKMLFLALSIGIFTALSGHASPSVPKFAVLSDLDDTLKVTHSVAPDESIIRSLFRREAFAGMPELMRSLEVQSERSGQSGVELYIVSGTPEAARFAVEDFTERHALAGPHTQIVLMKDSAEAVAVYKAREIRKIAKAQPDLSFVFLGDDTGHDADVYLDFQKEFPDRVLAIYIHRVNPGARAADLIDWESRGAHIYSTAFDVAYQEYLAGRLTEAVVGAVGSQVIQPDSLNSQLLPVWSSQDVRLSEKESVCNRLSADGAAATAQICEQIVTRLKADLARNETLDPKGNDGQPAHLAFLMLDEGPRILRKLGDAPGASSKVKAGTLVLRKLLWDLRIERKLHAPQGVVDITGNAIVSILHLFAK